MPITNDEIGLEAQFADELDDIAAELNGIAEQLRRKPYSAVKLQLTKQYSRLGELRRAARMVEIGEPDIAQRLMRKINDQPYEE